jgi:hypothetical protein
MTCVDELLEAVDDLSKMMRECDVSALEDDALAKLHRRVKQVNPQVQTFLHELSAKQICLKSKMDRLKGFEQVAKDHPEFVCPISHALMHDPVLAVDGCSYERRQIEALFDRGNTMIPITKINRMEMGTTLFPNITIKKAIERALEVELAAGTSCVVPTTEPESWAVDQATSLPEVWALVAASSGLVGAWRLTGVCRASRAGVKKFLGTLLSLVVCGGSISRKGSSEVWKLSMATLQWSPMPALMSVRKEHACCVVRGAIVVLGGLLPCHGSNTVTSSVEMLSRGKRVREASSIVMRWDMECNCHRSGIERQCSGSSAPIRGSDEFWVVSVDGAAGGPGYRHMHTAL